MKLGNITITLGANEAVIGAVIFIGILLMFVDVPVKNQDLFKLCVGALIAWGGNLVTERGKLDEKANPGNSGNPS